MTTALKSEIKKMARESVREALGSEVARLRELQGLYRTMNSIPIDEATPEEIKDFKRGRAEHEVGKFRLLSDVLHEMDHKFGRSSPKKSRKSSR